MDAVCDKYQLFYLIDCGYKLGLLVNVAQPTFTLLLLTGGGTG